MAVKVKNLKEQIGTLEPRPFLYCSICGAEYSANAGDYWTANPEHIFICCDEPILLMTTPVEYREVKS
jgi:hypothetical protein